MTARAWQERLAELGYYHGRPDGVVGTQTRESTRQYQAWLRDHGFDPGTIDGRPGPMTFAADAEYRSALATSYVVLPAAVPQKFELSARARALVYKFEVGGGRKYYDAKLARPSWPGYSSGLTIGLGYDLGYVIESQFRRDWGGILDGRRLDRLAGAIGVTGQSAQALPARFRDIEIPFIAAEAVFDVTTVPRFWAAARAAFPGIERLPADAQGALWSLVFNRGGSMGSRALAGYPRTDSRVEMREVRDYIAGGHLSAAAGAVERMARLWPDNLTSDNDLCDRRRAEAKLMRG